MPSLPLALASRELARAASKASWTCSLTAEGNSVKSTWGNSGSDFGWSKGVVAGRSSHDGLILLPDYWLDTVIR